MTFINNIRNSVLALAILTTTGFGLNTVHAEAIALTDIKAQGNVEVKISILDCGEMLLNDASLANPNLEKNSKMALSNPCYLISHPNGTLIWDAGMAEGIAKMENGIDVQAFHWSMKKTMSEQLIALNVDPSKVDYISFSHLHGDHTGNAGLFKNAKWIVQKSEYEVGFSEHAAQAFFQFSDYKHLKDSVVKINGNFDVFGDGSVVIVSTPGHTIGHQVLFVDLPKTKPIVLSGDLYINMLGKADGSMPVWNFNVEQTKASFKIVDNLLMQTGATLWIQHDMKQFNSLKKSPYYYQ